MPEPAYQYSAEVLRIVDADTVVLRVDLGWHIAHEIHGRLVGINTREKREPGGPEATAHLTELIPVGTHLTLRSLGADKFGGRWLTRLSMDDGRDVADTMITDGYAAPWDGKGEKPKPPWPPQPAAAAEAGPPA